MGENRWRDEQEWPLRAGAAHAVLPAQRARRAAGSTATAGSTARPDGVRQPPDTFTYDPAKPVPTGLFGAYSRMPVDRRDDSDARRRARLHLGAADRTARGDRAGAAGAVDVASSARHRLHRRAERRAARRHGAGADRRHHAGALSQRARPRRSCWRPDQRYELTIDVGATGNVFLPGHRIRLEVSSSNFPRYDRNPNTGAAVRHRRHDRRRAPDGLPRQRRAVVSGAAGDSSMTRPRALALTHAARWRRCSRGCSAPAPPPPRGPRDSARLLAAGVGRQLDLEKRFQDGVTADSMSALHRPLTERPHPAGSEGTQAGRQVPAGHADRLRPRRADPRVPGAADRPRKIEIALTAPAPTRRSACRSRRSPATRRRRIPSWAAATSPTRPRARPAARPCSSTTGCRPTTPS